MKKTILKIVMQAFGITMVSAAIAITTNLVRQDGIELVTAIPYEIFAPCQDSEVKAETASVNDISSKKHNILYIDARDNLDFEKEHIKGALNIPYSVLFGATDSDIQKVREFVQKQKELKVIVYGTLVDTADPKGSVDLSQPLADQLTELGIDNVRHLKRGLTQLKKNGVAVVKGQGAKE